MTSDPQALAAEEYRALRATIRERGSLRLLVAAITFVAWAALAFEVTTSSSLAVLALMPLVVLAGGHEVVLAAHVGVERIGRYLQVRFESPGAATGPQWEHLAMAVGPRASAGSGIDPLFSAMFILAALLNLIPVGLLNPVDSVNVPGGPVIELTVLVGLHALFIGRVFAARRYAAGQRARDLALFQSPS